MIPYILLIVIPALFQFVSIKTVKKKRVLVVGNAPDIYENNFVLPVFFFILLLLLVLRDESIGRDLSNYKYLFNYFESCGIDKIWEYDLEILYKLLNRIISQFTSSFQIFIGIVACLCVIPVALFYCQDRKHGMLKILLFVDLSTFVVMFSGLRQSIAVAFGIIAYQFVRKKKLIPFLVTVLVAFGFHQSALILFAMYPLYHVTLRKKHLLIIVPAMMSVFVFNRPLFSFLLGIMGQYSDKYVGETISPTGAFGVLILFALYAIFACVIPDETRMTREDIGLRNIMMLIVCIQCFAPLHSLAMRMNYYFLMFIPILMGRVLDIPQARYRQVAKFAEFVLIVFFLYEYVSSIYNSYLTGVSALDTVPYMPFWSE